LTLELPVHRAHDRLGVVRAGHRQHARMRRAHHPVFRAEAAGDDDLAVFLQRLADRRQRFRLGAVEEAAGVDDDEIGPFVLARELIAFGAQPRDDAFGIDQRLGAAE
jgi:hypothetical protein